MRSSSKVCIWNETDWDTERWVEIHFRGAECELVLVDVALDPEIAVVGRMPIDIDMLMAAANGATCDISHDDFHCLLRRDDNWAVMTFEFGDFPFPAEWRLGADWFQSAVWSCLAHRK